MLRALSSPAMDSLGGLAEGYAPEDGAVTIGFMAEPWMCHSEIIMQGGFITGMLDAAIAYSGFAAYDGAVRMTSLDINVSFLGAGNPGALSSVARPVRLGRTIGFFNAELFQNDTLIATATSTVRLVFPK